MAEVEKVDAWMPLWIGAYLADTTHLARDEHGGYLLLLIAYWRNRGPLVDQGNRLANICKATPAEWKRLRPLLVEFFEEVDGFWVHGRADKELASAGLRKSAAVSKAKAAAEARWGKSSGGAKSNAPSMPGALPEHVHEDCPTPSPSSSLRSEEILSGQAESKYPAEFEEAWLAYPDRPGRSKADACKAWKARVKAGAAADVILAGVRRYAAYCRAACTEPNYIKQPATFFGPGEHYLADWTATAQVVRPAFGGNRHSAAAAAIFDMDEPGASHA